jgi:hypothetical protein
VNSNNAEKTRIDFCNNFGGTKDHNFKRNSNTKQFKTDINFQKIFNCQKTLNQHEIFPKIIQISKYPGIISTSKTFQTHLPLFDSLRTSKINNFHLKLSSKQTNLEIQQSNDIEQMTKIETQNDKDLTKEVKKPSILFEIKDEKENEPIQIKKLKQISSTFEVLKIDISFDSKKKLADNEQREKSNTISIKKTKYVPDELGPWVSADCEREEVI